MRIALPTPIRLGERKGSRAARSPCILGKAMTDVCLADRHCVPCRGGVPPLTAAEQAPLLAELENWSVEDNHHLVKAYHFADFVSALAFANRVGRVAEEEGHHPEITVGWGHVRIAIWTHKIDGLTESDFVLAAKCDQALHA